MVSPVKQALALVNSGYYQFFQHAGRLPPTGRRPGNSVFPSKQR